MPSKPTQNNSNENGTSKSSMGFWLYVIGIAIIILSHLWLLNKGTMLSADDVYYHALLNLFAACLLIGGWWMKSSSEEETTVSNTLNTNNGNLFSKKDKKSTPFWEKLTGAKHSSQPSSQPSSLPSFQERMREKEPASGEWGRKPFRGYNSEYGMKNTRAQDEARAQAEIQRIMENRGRGMNMGMSTKGTAPSSLEAFLFGSNKS